jgi:voltage-gated sodium channel
MLKKIFFSDRIVFLAILFNAAVIFILSFPKYQGNHTIMAIDHLFVLFFLAEAVVKIKALSPKAYFADPWHRFDFLLVVVSIPSLLADYLPLPDTSLVLVLRLLRMLRMVRLLRFIPNIGHLVQGVTRAARASVFVLVLLVFLNFMLGIFTCHLYGSTLPNRFGDPLISCYTIFQLFTVEGWNEVTDELAANTASVWAAGAARFYFVLVVLIGGIFGMSLANAIFVDEMTMDNTDELEAKIDALQRKIDHLSSSLDKLQESRSHNP